MDPSATELIKWAGESGIAVGVLVFVLVRLERSMKSLEDSFERHAAWVEAWVQAHGRGSAGPPAGSDVRPRKP